MKLQNSNRTTSAESRTSSGPQDLKPAVPSEPVASHRIRVLLAEDHPIVRKGIRALLSNRPGIEVIDEARDGEEALRKAKALKPDVLVVDLEMPQANGFTVTEALRREAPQVKTLILSAHPGTKCVPRILQSGARGYLNKEASGEQLAEAVESIAAGGTCFSPEIGRLILATLVESARGPGAEKSGRLTMREREILTLIAEGLYNKEIGARLHIGTRTVETHRERIMNKLDIHSTAELTSYAVANGFVLLPQAPELVQSSG
jgi:two-component system, NarL family, nitrate/nitrite response regulator NarL